MVRFLSFRGRVTMINDFNIGQNGESEGCYKNTLFTYNHFTSK